MSDGNGIDMSLFGWIMTGFAVVNAIAWGMFIWDLSDKVPKFLSNLNNKGTTNNNFYIKSNNTQVNTHDKTIKIDKETYGA